MNWEKIMNGFFYLLDSVHKDWPMIIVYLGNVAPGKKKTH